MSSVSCNKKWSFPTSNCGLYPSSPMSLRTQSLAAGVCIYDVVTMTVDFDPHSDISYCENKAGDFPRTESKLVYLNCIAKGLMVRCIKFKLQDDSRSLGSMREKLTDKNEHLNLYYLFSKY